MNFHDSIEIAVIIAGALYAIGKWVFRREAVSSQIRQLAASIDEINDWREKLPSELELKFARRDILEAQLKAIENAQVQNATQIMQIGSDLKTLNSFLLNLFSGFDVTKFGGSK